MWGSANSTFEGYQEQCFHCVQVRSAEVEAELDAVREEANSRISQLEGANQEQTRLLQQHQSEAQGRRKQVADLEGKLHSRAGALADHSERAKQLQQVYA